MVCNFSLTCKCLCYCNYYYYIETKADTCPTKKRRLVGDKDTVSAKSGRIQAIYLLSFFFCLKNYYDKL